ncbi:MAG: NHL repeat-containing protein, partial [Saprospiraceae bacterium]|nr:NHL repeat-containing protein [Saprospiraceae bacterium]
MVIILLATSALAQENFFPLGAWMGYCWIPDWRAADTVKTAGFNMMWAGWSDGNNLARILDSLKSRGLKCCLTVAVVQNDSAHNLMRFSSGVYHRYEVESNPMFNKAAVYGYADGSCWSSQNRGYMLYWDSANVFGGKWWLYKNAESRMPMSGTGWEGGPAASYKAMLRLKYNDVPAGDTVCGVRWVKRNDGDPGIGPNGQAIDSMPWRILTTTDFAGPDIFLPCTLQYVRQAGTSRWYDFEVYNYGKGKVSVDYIDLYDAVYDSLNKDYNYIYSQAIQNIAETYSDTSVVFRYYLCDEPIRSQLEAYRMVDRRLRGVDDQGVPGMAIVVQQYPCSMGKLGYSSDADTAYYTEFVQKAAPAQLAIDILPIFGDSARWADAPFNPGSNSFATPRDSGGYLQRQLDLFCKYSRAANRAANGGGIPWWIQLQTYGDYRNMDTTQPSGNWRRPTPRELECMAGLALAHGAKGLLYYVYQGGNRMDYGIYGGDTLVDNIWYQMGVIDSAGNVSDPGLNGAIKKINGRANTWAKTLLDLTCDAAFRMQNGAIPTNPIISGISDSLVQAGVLHNKTNANDKYFMLVNRHCLPTDTLTVTVSISNAEPFFITDMLTGSPASGQLPAGANVPFSYKLQPGEGRLFRIVPFTAQIKINQNAVYTNFSFVQVDDPASSSLYSVDSVQIAQKYYVKTPEDTAARPDYIDYYWSADTSPWLPYSASSIQYLVNSVDNKANVFELQFKIGGGKILTPKYAAQIFFNDVSPVNGAITINNNANYTNSQTVNVKLSGTDLFPGLSQMRFSEAPFDNDSGYVNLVKNGCFDDTTDWIKQEANLDSGYAVISRMSVLGVPNYEDYGNYVAQVVTMPEAGQLVRLKADLYGKLDEIPAIQVYGLYNDTLESRIKYYLNKNIYDAEFLFTGNTVLNDTFTFIPPTDGTISKMMVLIGYPGIMSDQVQARAASIPPQPVILHSNIYVDNIRLEPVELKTGALPDNVPQNTYIFDGWDYADTNYSRYYDLSQDDGTKRVYLQLRDLPGNISSEPGWYDEIILDMTRPQTSISAPENLTYINGTISVRGYAWDSYFEKWVLEFKPSTARDWTLLTQGISPIHYKFPQTLCLWNTESLLDGKYLLKLSAEDKAGNITADTNYVYVANTPVVFPDDAVTSDFATFNSLPVDATCDNIGNVYVTDTQADKIWKFSPEGDSLLCFGYSYTGQDTLGLNHPKGIAVDDSGNIWITDCYQSKVKKYDSFGTYLSTLGKHGNQQGEFNQPTGIAISGNEVYVVDHLNGRVQVFNRAGAFIRQFGNNCLNQPAGIAIRNNDAEKLVYVCDSQNDRIAIFDTEGNLVKSLDSLGLDKPWDICFDNNNNLYIADVYHNRVIELDPWHNKLLTFGIQGQEAGQFKLPQGLAVSPDGK